MSQHETSAAPVVVHLYNENCFQCTHVNPKATRTGSKCHVSRGNALCPAGRIVFALGFDPEVAAIKYAEAMENGDAEGISKILAKLNDQPDSVRGKFFEISRMAIAQQVVDIVQEAPEEFVEDAVPPAMKVDEGAAEDLDSADWSSENV